MKMHIPGDRTLTLYQSKQRGRLYWYVCWLDDNGRARHSYIGKVLPGMLLSYWIGVQVAQDQLQGAIKREMAKLGRMEITR